MSAVHEGSAHLSARQMRGPSRHARAMAAAEAFLASPPHPYAALAERAAGVCLLARLVAGSEHAPPGVRASGR